MSLFYRTPQRQDLTALIETARPQDGRAARTAWLVQLMQWLRQPGPARGGNGSGGDEDQADAPGTPRQVLRLKRLLNLLERNEGPRRRVLAVLRGVWEDVDVGALFGEVGLAETHSPLAEAHDQLRARLLPVTPETDHAPDWFDLVFDDETDADWIAAIDDATLARLAALLASRRGEDADAKDDGSMADWHWPLVSALAWLVTSIRAGAASSGLRRRMQQSLLADLPFEQLGAIDEVARLALREGRLQAVSRQQAVYWRALLERCRAAVGSVQMHLAEHGTSAALMFEQERLAGRIDRLEAVLDALWSDQPAQQLRSLLVSMIRSAAERRGIGKMLGRQYSLLARKTAERHAVVGEHYIARDRQAYGVMLRAALLGGAVLAVTLILKFLLGRLGLAPFWAGLAAGLNYAVAFVLIYLWHGAVATKQPAMTAPSMAQRLVTVRGKLGDDATLERFVDEVARLVRSQMAGVYGNIGAVVPVALALSGLAWWATGKPLLTEAEARYALTSLNVFGLTPLLAAFTGVLLFLSSLIAGWVENFFVYHRLPSALAANPARVARLGPAKARARAAWWTRNISSLTSNISLGLLLGLVPAVLHFFGLPVDVRHVTLASGQVAAAVGTLGAGIMREPMFAAAVAGALLTGALNLAVSFGLALALALRARAVRGVDRRRVLGAVWRRFRRQPGSFLLPPPRTVDDGGGDHPPERSEPR